jgi:FMN reductase
VAPGLEVDHAQGDLGALNWHEASVGWLDLADTALPFCDGHAAYRDPLVGQVKDQIAQARGILVASPIYNFDVNAALKNLVELTSRAWQDKLVGLLCAAGGAGSYMSLMPFANSLMLDFRCLILPRFVYATGPAFSADEIQDSEVERRVGELAERLVALAQVLPPSPEA